MDFKIFLKDLCICLQRVLETVDPRMSIFLTERSGRIVSVLQDRIVRQSS